MIAKTEADRQGLRAAGKLLAEVLRAVARAAHPGISAAELDALAERLVREGGATPVFLGYRVEGIRTPYPATLCVSVNDAIVHGIPTANLILAEGDLVSFDCGLSLGGYIADAAVTEVIGKGSAEDEALAKAVREALAAGITSARTGGTVGDIGHAIHTAAQKHGFNVVRDLGGHGTGRALHEEPHIANFGAQGRGETLVEGMVLAIEPILTPGRGAIKLDADGWTYRTRDGAHAAHTEHTIIVGKNGGEVMTRG